MTKKQGNEPKNKQENKAKQIVCGHCLSKIDVQNIKSGQKIACPLCNQTIEVN